MGIIFQAEVILYAILLVTIILLGSIQKDSLKKEKVSTFFRLGTDLRAAGRFLAMYEMKIILSKFV